MCAPRLPWGPRRAGLRPGCYSGSSVAPHRGDAVDKHPSVHQRSCASSSRAAHGRFFQGLGDALASLARRAREHLRVEFCVTTHSSRAAGSPKRETDPSRALCARNVFPVWLLVFGSESTAPHCCCCCCCCMLLATSYLGTLHFVALLSRLGDALSVRNSSGHLDRVDPLPSPSPLFFCWQRVSASRKLHCHNTIPPYPEYTTLHAAEVVVQRGQWVGVGDSRRRPQSWHKPLACAVLLQVHWWTSDPMGDTLGGGHVWWRWRLVEIPTDIREAQQCSRD